MRWTPHLENSKFQKAPKEPNQACPTWKSSSNQEEDWISSTVK
jgi:hypothetical protein